MNEQRARAILNGQTAVARRVFALVPLHESRSSRDIYRELSSTGNLNLAVVTGCLKDLVANGLVRETSKLHYMRRAGLTMDMAVSAMATTLPVPKLAEVLAPVIVAGSRPAQPIPKTEKEVNTVTKQILPTAGPKAEEEDEPVDTLEQMSDIALAVKQRIDAFTKDMTDLQVELSEDMDRLRDRLGDVALQIVNERKASGDAAKTLKMLRGLLAGKED